jgi:uncharacterized protein (DUF433 family)
MRGVYGSSSELRSNIQFRVGYWFGKSSPTIRAFCELIRALPRPAKRIWNEAKRRDFSIGIQAADEPGSKDFPLSADTLMQAAKVGAHIVITVYAPQRSVVTRDPAIMSGEPVFRGTRVLVTTLFEYLEVGKSFDEFLESFPTVTRGQALTLFQEAKGTVGDESEILVRARRLLHLVEA